MTTCEECEIVIVRPFNLLSADDKILFGPDGSNFVVVFGTDSLPVLYVRLRSEYNETETQAILRAKRIVEKINS